MPLLDETISDEDSPMRMSIWGWVYEDDYMRMSIWGWVYEYDYMSMSIWVWVYEYEYMSMKAYYYGVFFSHDLKLSGAPFMA